MGEVPQLIKDIHAALTEPIEEVQERFSASPNPNAHYTATVGANGFVRRLRARRNEYTSIYESNFMVWVPAGSPVYHNGPIWTTLGVVAGEMYVIRDDRTGKIVERGQQAHKLPGVASPDSWRTPPEQALPSPVMTEPNQ